MMNFENLDVWKRSTRLSADIYIAIDINYIESDVGRAWLNETFELSKMLTSLISKIKTRI
ncbi:MAG: hypothetical protein ACTH36_02200 [Pseudoalteromonas nigrifaciens]